MKKIAFWVIMLLLGLEGFAQKGSGKITFIEPFKKNRMDYVTKSLLWGEEILMVQLNGISVKGELFLINPSGTIENSAEFRLSDLDRGAQYEATIKMKEEVWILYSIKQEKEYIIKAFPLEKEGLGLGDPITLGRCQAKLTGFSSTYSDFKFAYSHDSTKFILWANSAERKEEKISYHISVFEKGLKKMWDKEISLPYDEDLFSVKDYTADDEGNMYILGKLYEKKYKETRRGEVNYAYKVLKFMPNKEMVENTITLDQKYVTDMRIDISPANQDILCAGFYSDKGSNSVKGAFFASINQADNKFRKVSFKEFTIDFMTENLSESQANRVKKQAAKGKEIELPEYELREMIIREDGGCLINAEQYYDRTVTTTSNTGNGMSSTRTTTYYYHNSIIVINISKEGDIEWANIITKRQMSTTPFYSSYYFNVKGDKLYYIFNDHTLNGNNPNMLLSKTKNGITIPKYNALAMVTVNSKGEMKKETLLYGAETKKIFAPGYAALRLSPNQVMFWGSKRLKYQMALLEF